MDRDGKQRYLVVIPPHSQRISNIDESTARARPMFNTVVPSRNPPNFLIQANLHTYVTQEVVVPQEPEEEPISEGTLIDTTDFAISEASTSSICQSHLELLGERDKLIKHLQTEIERLRNEITKVVVTKDQDINTLQDQITTLETELVTKDSELVQERQIKEDLFHQASAVAQSQDSEHKAKEEKFNKVKELYVKLREDHIQLLRQKAEVEKKVNGGFRRIKELEHNNSQLEDKIQELNVEHTKQESEIQQSSQIYTQEVDMLTQDKELLVAEMELLKQNIESVIIEKSSVNDSLQAVIMEKQTLHNKVSDMTGKIGTLQQELSSVKIRNKKDVGCIIIEAVTESKVIIENAILEVDNPALAAVSCSPDYFRSLTEGCSDSLEAAQFVTHDTPSEVIKVATRISHRHAIFLLQGRAASNSSPDIMFGERMAEKCKKLGNYILKVLDCLKKNESVQTQLDEAQMQLKEVTSLAETISGSLSGQNSDNLSDMLEDEMAVMDKAIEEAANKIQEMLNKSREADSGLKLEVNEKILDSCTTLMMAIKVLIQKSRFLQAEIVAQGKGTASAKEFYKRNHQWTDGFISAAKAVAVAATFLLGAADKVISGQGKLEQLVVAAQEIAASTAQLVVASRVKADRKSPNLEQLTLASKGVTTATGTVVATVKVCSELMEDEVLDTSKLTLHQAKRFEMEAQVRVLELEKELEQERLRLSALRKHHYQMAKEDEGWDVK